MTHYYQLDPTAPLVFRSGRPFGSGGRDGSRFPWPSAIAGALRTAWMRDEGDVHFQRAQESLECAAAGPFLIGPKGLYVPKPADALVLRDEDAKDTTPALRIHRMRPGKFAEGCGSTLPQGLCPVVVPTDPVGKPQRTASFWRLDQLLAWDSGQPFAMDQLEPSAEPAPFRHRQTSTHVQIDRKTGASKEGQLFQIEGLDFGRARHKDKDGFSSGFSSEHWALGARFSTLLTEGLIHLGGERRATWLQSGVDHLFAMPPALAQAISTAPGVALTFCTPALFSQGWKPGWLDNALCGEFPGISGLRLRLIACALERWQGISGWDLARQQPKPARKAVAAGSTYWFEILERPTDAQWPQTLWLASLSDATQDRRDGWGTVIPRIAQDTDFSLCTQG